jgi:hypothetical protein
MILSSFLNIYQKGTIQSTNIERGFDKNGYAKLVKYVRVEPNKDFVDMISECYRV